MTEIAEIEKRRRQSGRECDGLPGSPRAFGDPAGRAQCRGQVDQDLGILRRQSPRRLQMRSGLAGATGRLEREAKLGLGLGIPRHETGRFRDQPDRRRRISLYQRDQPEQPERLGMPRL